MKNICVYCSASDGISEIYYKDAEKIGELIGKNNFDLVYGCILCEAELVDCIYMTEEFIEKLKKENYNEYLCGRYEVGRYAWVLKNIKPIKPIFAKGQLGIWNYNDKLTFDKNML